MTKSQAAVLAALALCCSADTPKSVSALDRLERERLEATREVRLKWSRERIVHPNLGVYRDFRAILHVHAEDAEHTLGTREQVLSAAKQTGVNIILWTDHRGPAPDTWRGLRDGVLFIVGSEDDHQLRFPETNGADLKFLSHVEETPEASSDGFDGMEIYNRHTDAKLQREFAEYLKRAVAEPGEFRKLASKFESYPDEVFAAGTGYLSGLLAKYDQEIAKRRFTAIAANDAHRNQVFHDVVLDPYEVAFRNVSTHILARELKEEQIRESLREGHAYIAHDWLCDPSGFAFVAANNLGVFDMGDRVPMLPKTQLVARLPVPGHVKLIHNGNLAAETRGTTFNFTPKEPGAYRLEVWLDVAGEERPWIYSNPLYLETPNPGELSLPAGALAPNVKAVKNISYVEGAPQDAGKHQLDLYLPTDKTNFPVMFFVHGGAWRNGDRSLYPALANRFAKLGIGVVIPSYRLAPKNPHPAQIEDVAAAFAWTVRNISEHGGDPSRIFVAGHSAGGHLVSLLALNPAYLARHDLKPGAIRGVMSLSGVYDVRRIELFGSDEQARRAASPIAYVNRHAPPFLVTYCQWDYAGLPAQAREFDRALRRNFVASALTYIPGESHISEMVRIWRDDDPTARAMLRFMDDVQP
jgi:acetyl esterase/lipase